MTPNRFDMVQLYLPYSINLRDKSNIYYTTDETGSLVSESVIDNGISIKTNFDKNYTTIRISSKCLGSNMLDFISINNIGRIFEIIERKIDITFENFINTLVTKVEVSKDILTEYPPEDIIECLFELSKYLKDFIRPKSFYKHNNKATSGYIKRNNQDPKHIEYFSYYIKSNEFFKEGKARNNLMYDNLNEIERANLKADMENKIRLELKLNSREKIRQHFKTKQEDKRPTLLNILSSELNVLKNAFEKFFSKAILLSKKGKKSKNYNDLGDSYILEAHNRDLVAILSILKSYLSNRQAARIIERMKQSMANSNFEEHSKMETMYISILSLL